MDANDQDGFTQAEMRGQFLDIFINVESQLKAVIVESLSEDIRVQNRIKGILLFGSGSSHLIGLFENLLALKGRTKEENMLIERLKQLNKIRNLFAHQEIIQANDKLIFMRDHRKMNVPSLLVLTQEELSQSCIEMMGISVDLQASGKLLAKEIRKAIDAEWAPEKENDEGN